MGATDRFLKRGRIQDFSRGPIAKMLSELRKFGANGHLYIPGVGTINGITAGNYLDSLGTTAASVDGNVGLVKDAANVSGINVTQATTGYKPVLRRGIVNLLTQSEFQNGLTDAPTRGGLVSLSSIGSKNAIAFGHDGATNSYAYKAYSAVVGSTNTIAVIVKMDSGNAPAFGSATSLSTLNDFLLKAASSELVPATYTVADAGSGLYVVAATGVASGYQAGVVKYGGNSANTFKVTGYGLFQGTLTAQQILAAGGIPLTTTAAASSSAGAYKWEFDGQDDSMSLGVVPFQMSDDHCVIAMGNNLAGSGTRYIIDFGSAGSANPICGSVGFSNSAVVAQWRDDAGTANLLSGGNFPPGTQAVVTARKVGNSFSLRANGAQVLANLATLSTTTLTGGKLGVRVFGSNLYQGVISGVVVIKGTVTDAQALIFERGLNALSQYAAGRF